MADRSPPHRVPEQRGGATIVGESPAIQTLRRLISRIAPHDRTVLIEGETGTGKELVARRIHAESKRAAGSFVVVNCAAIPEGLLESELFGHERGSFTGAHERKLGMFELADGGTLFLDEIGELPLEVQAKLLRAVEIGEVWRTGGLEPIYVQVRLVAATNRDLLQEVEEGRFRRDLYMRLDQFRITPVPLRERAGDIRILIRHFLDEAGFEGRRFSAEAEGYLEVYPWPGNVRELKHTVENAPILVDDLVLGPDALRREIRERVRGKPTQAVAAPVESPLGTLAEAKRRHIHRVLKHTGGNKAEAARILEIDVHSSRLPVVVALLGGALHDP